MYFPTLCPKGTQKPINLNSSPKCWHDISNTNIYIQLIYIFPNVYSTNIYFPKYIKSQNIYFPTLCPKGTRKPSNLHSSPKCWHDIFNTNIYIQMIHIPKMYISPPCARRAHRNPSTYIHPPSVGII